VSEDHHLPATFKNSHGILHVGRRVVAWAMPMFAPSFIRPGLLFGEYPTYWSVLAKIAEANDFGRISTERPER
jgi:hypothetical protein